MSEVQNTENASDWIEEAIAKEYLKYYEYQNFSNIREIGTGGFGKVFRANWKDNLEQYLVLKSFLNLNNITVKEIVREVIIYLIYNVMYCRLCNSYYFLFIYFYNLA